MTEGPPTPSDLCVNLTLSLRTSVLLVRSCNIYSFSFLLYKIRMLILTFYGYFEEYKVLKHCT